MPAEQSIDPVCGMTIDLPVVQTRLHGDATYHFCSVLCAGRFDQDADAYATVSRMNLPGWGRTQTPGFLLQDR
jgi:YHS domain-containing protein